MQSAICDCPPGSAKFHDACARRRGNAAWRAVSRDISKPRSRAAAFYGQTVQVTGFHRGNCIGFVAVGSSVTGDRVVSYTGLLRHGKMETAWFVVADQALSAANEGDPAKLKPLNWWRAVTTNVDTFERI